MILLWDIIFALLVGALITLVFTAGFRSTRPASSILAFFLIIFLMGWAGGVWIAPVGPPMGMLRIFPFLMVALIGALLIAALIPPWYRPRNRGEAMEEAQREEQVLSAFNVFFWILMAFLIGAIIAGYMVPRL